MKPQSAHFFNFRLGQGSLKSMFPPKNKLLIYHTIIGILFIASIFYYHEF